MPWYDQWGWASETEIPGRFTDTPLPTNIPQGYAANWTGYEWRVVAYSPPPSTSGFKITQLAFIDRFTEAEWVAFDLTSIDNPNGTLEQRQQQSAMRRFMKKVDLATYIDLNNANTRAGVQALEYAGLLAAGRAAEILDTPPTESEIYGMD